MYTKRDKPRKVIVVMKSGLVIEGGGVRGIYAAGVLVAFMKMVNAKVVTLKCQ